MGRVLFVIVEFPGRSYRFDKIDRRALDVNSIRLGLVLLVVSMITTACDTRRLSVGRHAVQLKCDCRCAEVTEGVTIAGDIRLGLSITQTGLCTGHIGNECTTNADIPPGGIVNGTITECQLIHTP